MVGPALGRVGRPPGGHEPELHADRHRGDLGSIGPANRRLPVDAVSIDFFDTLVHLRGGIGRGRRILEYFESVGLSSDPWDHRILYDVFQPETPSCCVDGTPEARAAYLARLTERLFTRLNVTGPGVTPGDHVEKIWELLGPGSFVVFPDGLEALRRLRAGRVAVAIVSNWPCGLSRLCGALGIAEHVDHIVCSAEVGFEKPDARIFEDACRRLGVAPSRTLHVGDTVVDDLQGASNAGLRALLIRRHGHEGDEVHGAISDLREIPALLGLTG